MIIGIDEVGRGAWAGPVVVGAVGLAGAEIDGLTDSKALTKKRRQALYRTIKQIAPRIGIGWVSARDIDRIGIAEALRVASIRAISQVSLEPSDQVIIDGTINFLKDHPSIVRGASTTTMKKADLLVPSVSAASVIAKVARDDYMALCDRIFPGYGWPTNVGYGASFHRQAIDQLGMTPLHRLSFQPMKSYAQETDLIDTNLHMPKNANAPTAIGHLAETSAIDYLTSKGYQIIDRNWQTKWCEIDIIASRQSIIYFIEVRYRKSSKQGGGLATITNKKIQKMRFAGQLWLSGKAEQDARLGVIEVSGDDYLITSFIDDID